jgi:hypothetical protein
MAALANAMLIPAAALAATIAAHIAIATWHRRVAILCVGSGAMAAHVAN